MILGTFCAFGCGEKKDDAKGSASGDSIGIAECDDYFKKAESCMGKMPAEAKAAFESGMKQSKDAWKAAASGPGKDTLKTTCKAAADALASNPACK